MRKFAVSFSVLTVLSFVLTASAYTMPEWEVVETEAQLTLEPYRETEAAVTAPSYILMETTTGMIAAGKNTDVPYQPESLAKMMTALLIAESLESGTMKLSDTVTASENACNVGGVEIWLVPGETMTVEDLLTAILIGSGNDAAVALAEYHSGSEEAFTAVMNRKAAELGMKNTTFIDASGYGEYSQTTAYDMALLSCALLRHETIVSHSSVWMYDLRQGETQLVNTNRLVRFFEGCVGLKTGVGEEGNAISAAARKGEKSFVAVAMGVEKTEDSFEDVKALLNDGFEAFELIVPEVDPSLLRSVRVTDGVCSEVGTLLPEEETKVLVKSEEKSAVTVEVVLPEEVSAPVCKGQQLGTVRIKNGDFLLAEQCIAAADDVDVMNFYNAFLILLRRILC